MVEKMTSKQNYKRGKNPPFATDQTNNSNSISLLQTLNYVVVAVEGDN